MRRLGFSLVLISLVSACSAPPPETVRVDRVEAPVAAVTYSVLSPERLLVEGSAEWGTMTLREVIERRTVTEADRESAARVLASGAFLGDEVPVLHLTPAGATDRFRSGTAYLTGAFPLGEPPGSFEMEVTFDLHGGEGASVGLSIELREPDEEATGDVGELLITLLDPGVDASAELTVSTRGAGPTAPFEPVGGASLEARDWRGAHRLRLDYRPGRLAVSLDDEPLVAADVRLERPAGPVYLGAFASAPTMGATLLDWIFVPLGG